jgi:hypothetical protein
MFAVNYHRQGQGYPQRPSTLAVSKVQYAHLGLSLSTAAAGKKTISRIAFTRDETSILEFLPANAASKTPSAHLQNAPDILAEQ